MHSGFYASRRQTHCPLQIHLLKRYYQDQHYEPDTRMITRDGVSAVNCLSAKFVSVIDRLFELYLAERQTRSTLEDTEADNRRIVRILVILILNRPDSIVQRVCLVISVENIDDIT